jgi:peptide/nickel transport system substrate-binding protein
MSGDRVEKLVEDFRRSKYTRREFVLRAMYMGMSAGAIGGLLQACAPAAEPEPTTAPEATEAPKATEAPEPTSAPVATFTTVPTEAPAAEGPRQGGSLIYGIHNEIQPIDWSTPWACESMCVDIYEYLSILDPQGEVKPWLATNEVADDWSTITFKLQEGKKFHSGDPLDAEAVKANFETWLDPENGYWPEFYRNVTSVEAPDDTTIVLNLDKLDTDALRGTCFIFSPMGNDAMRKANPDAYGRTMADGTGPYKFKSWEGDTLTVERFDDYFGAPGHMDNKGPTYLDQKQYIWLPDQSMRSVNLETGEFDMVEQPAPQDIERLDANPDITVLRRNAPAMLLVQFNHEREIPADRNVREAVYRAIDRKPIVDQVLFGAAYEGFSNVVPHDDGYWEGSETLYPHDPTKAGELLEESGWMMGADDVREKDGEPLELTMIIKAGTEERNVGQVVQQQLAAVGIKVNLEVLDAGSHFVAQEAGEFDLCFFRYWYDSSINVLKALYHSTVIPVPNWSRWNNAETDKWLDTFNLQDTSEKRIEAIVNYQKAMLAEVADVPIYNPMDVWALNKWVKGFKVQNYMCYNMHNDLYVTEESPRA